MNKVWIVSDMGHDYTTAKQHGEPIFLYPGKINVFASCKLITELCEKLRPSDKEDFLLPSGNSMATCIAFSILMQKHGKVNMLIYSFRNNLFEVRTILQSQYSLYDTSSKEEVNDNVGNR